MFQNSALTSEFSAMLSSHSALHAGGANLWYSIFALKRNQFSMYCHTWVLLLRAAGELGDLGRWQA